MSEMYEYLQEHNYISRNKNKDPFRQQELSKERAETIANKCDNLLQQKESIIKELNDKIEDDKMIIEGNWGCIDNLKKDYNLQKSIIKEVRDFAKGIVDSGEDFDGFGLKVLEMVDKENI